MDSGHTALSVLKFLIHGQSQQYFECLTITRVVASLNEYHHKSQPHSLQDCFRCHSSILATFWPVPSSSFKLIASPISSEASYHYHHSSSLLGAHKKWQVSAMTTPVQTPWNAQRYRLAEGLCSGIGLAIHETDSHEPHPNSYAPRNLF